MAPAAAQLLREVLTPLAHRYAINYDLAMLGEEEERPEVLAFHFLPAGAWLLVLYVEADDFPAEGRRTRRRAAKCLARSFVTPGAQRATILLTHAVGLYVAERLRQAGEEQSAEGHRGLVELVASHYPLGDAERATLDAACGRLRRDETALDTLTGGAEVDGEPPEGRRWAAQDLYRGTVTLEALRLALGDERFGDIADELTLTRPDISFDAVARMRADARWWTDAAGNWNEAAHSALS